MMSMVKPFLKDKVKDKVRVARSVALYDRVMKSRECSMGSGLRCHLSRVLWVLKNVSEFRILCG